MAFTEMSNHYDSYLRDESRRFGVAEHISFPKSTKEISKLMRLATENGLKVTVQGARTGIVAGGVPCGGAIISTEKCKRILGLRKGKDGLFRLQVEAGVSLETVDTFLKKPLAQPEWPLDSSRLLQELAAASPLMFPPNPTEKTASIGGLFACNATGSNSLLFGDTSSYVDKLTWVTPAGEIWEIERGKYIFDHSGCPLPNGGRLTCQTDINTHGLSLLHPLPEKDLIDFLAASEGILGIAAELELRLLPQPKECWGVVYFFRQTNLALEFAQGLAEWKVASHSKILSCVEYYDEAVLSLIREHQGSFAPLKNLSAVPPTALSAIYVVLEGDDGETLETALMEHLELFESLGGHEEDSWAAGSRFENEAFQTLRHSVPELINTLIDQKKVDFPALEKTATDFSAPASRMGEYCLMYQSDIKSHNLDGYVFGHILENRLHVNFIAQTPEQLSLCHTLINQWAEKVVLDEGILAGENGIGKTKIQLVAKHTPPHRKAQIAKIKNFFDPASTLGNEWS